MVYYETPGVIRDVASFFVSYYNEEYVFNKLNNQYNEEEEQHLRYFYQIKDSFSDLPFELHPIIYCDEKRHSIITEVLYDQPFQTITVDKFLDYIVSEKFKKRVYQYWFNTTEATNLRNFDFVKEVPQLQLSEQIKYKLIIFLNDYERYIKEFVNLFIQLYESIIELRERQKENIERMIIKADQEDCYKKMLSACNIVIPDFSYSIVIINTLLLQYNNQKKWILFGVECSKLFGSAHNCSMESFAYAYSDTTRAKIVEIVSKYQPICATDIYGKLETNCSTIYHHLNILTEEGILISKKSTDRKLYFRINVGYFENMYRVSQDTLQVYQKSSVKLE